MYAANNCTAMIPGTRWLRMAVLVAVAVVAANGWFGREVEHAAPAGGDVGAIQATAGHGIPTEGERTLQLIQRGGPFPYERDGATFHNREGRLPAQPTGYYREYTVPTPGSPDRGARRIVTGGDPPREYYYTDDHYRTFRRIEVAR